MVVKQSRLLLNDPLPLPWLLTCCYSCLPTAIANLWPGCLTRHWQVLGGGCQHTRWPGSVHHSCPPTLPLFSSWLLGPIYAFMAFVKPGDVAVMVVESERVGGLFSSNGGLRRL